VIQNTGSTSISGWSLSWSFDGNQQITQAWNSNLVGPGPRALLTNASWNATIAPGSYASGIGFNASYSVNNKMPTAFFLNNRLCQ
jgi:hypothetical protein